MLRACCHALKALHRSSGHAWRVETGVYPPKRDLPPRFNLTPIKGLGAGNRALYSVSYLAPEFFHFFIPGIVAMSDRPKIVLPPRPGLVVPFNPEHAIFGYGGLVRAFVNRRRALGWTLEELDERANWQERYGGHLENWQSKHGRVAGSFSLPRWMETLGICLYPIEWGNGDSNRPFLSTVDLSRRLTQQLDESSG